MNKEQLEEFYTKVDPWGFESNKDDDTRKQIILDTIAKYGKSFKKALDVGAGEGFITKDLPAKEIYAYEISDKACDRFPENVKRVQKLGKNKYDLIIATGVLYKEYEHEALNKLIKDHACGIVLTSNIKSLELNTLPEDKKVEEFEFPYREYTQHLVVYNFEDVSTPQPRKRKTKSTPKRSK